MEGDISLLSIPELLQMICLGGHNRDVHLFDGPTQLGVIGIRNGHIDRCFGFGMWGEAAFFKLVKICRGRYKVNDAQDTSGADATLTAYSWQELLMEAARREDEAARVTQSATTGTIAFSSPTGRAVNHEAAPMVHSATASVAVPTVMSVTESPTRPRAGVTAVTVDEHPGEGSVHPDIAKLLEEATTCYLRRDLVGAESLLRQCLVLHPGDKRTLQNLERIRRKKVS